METKKEEISSRDINACVSCKTSKSIWFHGFNLSINKKGKRIYDGNYSQVSIDDHFGKSGYHRHKIMVEGEHFVVLSQKDKIPVLVPYQYRKFDKLKDNLFKINIVGDKILIADKRDRYMLKKEVIIHKITEFPIVLHCHHKLYYDDRLPWEYELDELETLCHKCHKEFHESSTVPVYRKNDDGVYISSDVEWCKRCGGAGVFPEYSHVENGVCFECGGFKFPIR